MSDSDSDMGIFVGATWHRTLQILWFDRLMHHLCWSVWWIRCCSAIQCWTFHDKSVYIHFWDCLCRKFKLCLNWVHSNICKFFGNGALPEPAIPGTTKSFEIVCASQVISGNCSASMGGQLVKCHLVPSNGIYSDTCRDAPFYLIANASLVMASSYISRVTIRSSSFVMTSFGSPSKLEVFQDLIDAS